MSTAPLEAGPRAGSISPAPDQRQVLDHERGSLLVTGPPGSGKTWLLRERFARLVEGGTDPEKVALFTLHRRAARDGREALVRRLGRSLADLPVFTVHGFAFRVVARRFDDLGYPEPPAILSAPEQYALVRRLLAEDTPGDWPRFAALLRVRGFAEQVADFVLRAQERLLDPDALDALVERSGKEEYREVSRFYRRYLEEQHRAGRVDFAGLLRETVGLLERDLSEAEAFAHVLVDDYQDATPAAEGILRALGRAAQSVVVAADPAGHVFSYRGGTTEPLARLGDTLPGLRRIELATLHREAASSSALRVLADPEAPAADGDSPIEAHVFAHPGEEADAAAHTLLRWRVDRDLAWKDMAVVLRRYGPYLTALRHALARHDVPYVVVAEAAAVATEPANRPVIDLFRYVCRPERRDDLLERLLLSPVVGVDPHALRELRRQARMRGRTLLELVEDKDRDLSPDLLEPVERFRALVRGLHDRAPDDAFFWVWTEVPHYRELVASDERSRDLDALAALGEVLANFVERRPEATLADYLDTLEAAEFGADPWTPPEERHPHAVRILSAHQAHGMEFDSVIVVGCLEGEFPSLGAIERLVDLERLVAPATPVERLRRRLAEERALFRLAVSRAGRRTVLTASHSQSSRNPRTPSRFAARLGLDWGADEEAPEAASLRTMEADLRLRVADAAAPTPDRLAALAGLTRVGADPASWWGARDWTDPGEPLHEGEIVTSFSRLSTMENCGLQYLYASEMGLDPERSHNMWLGSLIHDLIDRVHKGELPREERRLLHELDRRWQPNVFWSRALERQRRRDAEKMIRQWVRDGSLGEVLASEAEFRFPLDGAVVRGKIDAIYRMGAARTRVVDYKTSRSQPAKSDVAESLQLGTYYLAMRRVPELAELGEPDVLEFGYLFLEGTDEGYKHFTMRPDRTPDFERQVEGTMLQLLERVRKEEFAPSPDADCQFCPFKPICPLWPEGAEVRT
jgi:superfamily I DNA/RNA helicase/RecB family exonuclease